MWRPRFWEFKSSLSNKSKISSQVIRRQLSIMRNRLKTIVIVIAGWTFIAFLFTPQTYLSNAGSYRPLTWFEAAAFNALIFYLWALLTPFVWMMGKWFPLENKERQHNFINLFVLAFPVTLFHLVLLQQA